ncbi:hypothetical protein AB0D94_33790 [Streptomyces sp. NPDC048255]|uniref:hypothetical protein n=1 Tax=Streptomyces sp. NPDC048255 TaxID=3154713 RepID=UPI0033EB8F4E
MTVLLVLLLTVAVGGAACVVWAERGGPPWVRVVARVTLGIGSLVRSAGKSRSRGVNRSGGNSDGGE